MRMDWTPYLTNAAVVLIVALAFPLAHWVPPFGELIRWLDDLSYRWQIAAAPDPGRGPDATERVQIIDLDRQTFAETGARAAPIDRGLLAQVLERIATAKPAVVVVDIDIGHRLRPLLAAEAARWPLPGSWLARLDADDDRLVAVVNRLLEQGIPVVIGTPATASANAEPMAFDLTSDRLSFGRTGAWIEAVDRVIYGLPTWLRSDATGGCRGPAKGSGGVVEAPRPSLALATWAAVNAIGAGELRAGRIAAGADPATAATFKRLGPDRCALVNWYRLTPTGQVPSIPRLSAATLLRADPPPASLAGRVVVVGRTHFVEGPIVERPDRHLTPYAGVRINGVDLQALFIDNLLGRHWLAKPGWLLALSVGSGLSILLGSLYLALIRHVAASGSTAVWVPWLTDPLLAVAVGLVLSLLLAALVNLLFLQRGMYMASLTLIPLSGFLEALIYAAWMTRP